MVSVIYTIYIKIQGPYVDFAVKKKFNIGVYQNANVLTSYMRNYRPHIVSLSVTLSSLVSMEMT